MSTLGSLYFGFVCVVAFDFFFLFNTSNIFERTVTVVRNQMTVTVGENDAVLSMLYPSGGRLRRNCVDFDFITLVYVCEV